MSTSANEFLERVRERMAALRVTQEGVAKSCGLSQPHLSKVLANKIKMGSKTQSLLATWMVMDAPKEDIGAPEELRQLVGRLLDAPTERRMQIMQLLRLLDALTR